jgi:phosphatidate cytidylyltransferase
VGANLKSRAITAAVAIPLLIALIVWGSPWLFTGIFFLVTVAALREYFTMVFPAERAKRFCGVALGSIVALLLILPQIVESELWLGLLAALCFTLYIFVKAGSQHALKQLAWILLGCVYLGYLLPHWVLLFRLPHGRAWVFFVLWVIMAGDSVAYFVGSRFGRRKLAPRISPGKTVEGAWGYIAGSVIAGFFGALFIVPELHWLEAVGLAAWLSILGQAGDLFESWLKRTFAMKDSGNLLPGHGGLLDRLDSLIFPAVFSTAYIKVFHS